MSHLTGPRLTFAGRFLSDVSTRNNSSENYENPPAGPDLWNALGGGTLEPLGCRVTGAWLDATAHTDDPAVGYALSGADDRPSAKMVDLDPDWQMASELWGFRLRIFDSSNGALAVEGEFTPASFRDLYTRQFRDPGAENGQPAGGRYVSTLTDVTWGPAASQSAVMRALRDATRAGELAVCLHQFGYYYATSHARYRTGTLIGSIGPRLPDEAQTAQVSRRLLPFRTQAGTVLSAVDLMVGSSSLGADLGHALIIDDPDGTITDLGDFLKLGATRSIAIGLAPPAGAVGPLPDEQVTIFGETKVLEPGWYPRSGGIAEWPLDATAQARVVGAPLHLYLRTERGLYPCNAETAEGLFVRTDSFVRRLDSGDTVTVAFNARRLGQPAVVTIALGDPVSPSDGQPRADALTYPRQLVTDQHGHAELHIGSGHSYRRDNIDGMVFAIPYTPHLSAGPAAPATVGLGALDQVVVHQREPFAAPAAPDWGRDVLPVLRQYAYLYPVMSRHLFDLADEGAVRTHARHMLLAMARPITDPNYMPVTRDLSDAKRDMILRWLQGAVSQTNSQLVERRLRHEHTAVALPGPAAAGLAPPGDTGPDAKTTAARIASGLTGAGEG